MPRLLRATPQVLVAALGVSPIPDDHIELKTIFARSHWKWDGVPTLGRHVAGASSASPEGHRSLEKALIASYIRG
jgi:hypothetical protein